MKYALISDNTVMEIIEPYILEDGTEVPVNERFTPEFVATLVDVTKVDPAPSWNWKAVMDDKNNYVFSQE